MIRTDPVPLVAAALAIPLALFQVMGYDINPAFALAPLVAWAFVVAVPDRFTVPFVLAGIGGLISIAAANIISPDDPVRSLLGLTLMLIAPSFLFIGRWIIRRGNDLASVVYWLAVFSTVFLIPVVARLLITGEPVRGAIGWQGFAVLNAEWLGLPVFATFGVISLAYLICLQMMLLAGALFIARAVAMKAFLTVGLACAVFMVLGSDSRAAQLCVVWLAATAIIAPWLAGSRWSVVGQILTVIIVAAGVTFIRVDPEEMRMVQTAQTVAEIMHESAPSSLGVPSSSSRRPAPAADITTGRSVLIAAGWRETIASPVIGNGFSDYGRYSDEEPTGYLAANSSTHIFYLTLFWKGGVLFAAPFLVFLTIAAWRAFKARPWQSPHGLFVASAVLLAFGPMALTWDILYVPSAGALSWFLLGTLGVIHDRTA